jgi:peptide/nickel transport system permease protein
MAVLDSWDGATQDPISDIARGAQQNAPRRLAGWRPGLGVAGTIGAIVVGLWILAAILGPIFGSNAALQNNLGASLQPPVLLGGHWSAPLGTDELGRNILVRILVGARPSAEVSFLSVAVSAAVGVTLGCIGGFTRSRLLDIVIMRAADLTLAFPIFLLALLLAVQRGPSLSNVIIVLGLLLWAQFAKLARSEVLVLRSKEFIWLAVVAGASRRWIFRKHLLPNVLPSVLVLATFQLGVAVLAEATLSFLGAGIPPPAPAWGSMVASGEDVLQSAWWVSVMPAIAIAIAVLAITLLGDAVRDRLDPKIQSAIGAGAIGDTLAQ